VEEGKGGEREGEDQGRGESICIKLGYVHYHTWTWRRGVGKEEMHRKVHVVVVVWRFLYSDGVARGVGRRWTDRGLLSSSCTFMSVGLSIYLSIYLSIAKRHHQVSLTPPPRHRSIDVFMMGVRDLPPTMMLIITIDH